MESRRIKIAPRRPAAPAPGSLQRGTVQVRAEAKVRGEIRGSSSSEVTLLEREFSTERPAAFVRVGAGLTINTGNFESLRLDVAVTLPCLASEVQDGYIMSSDYVAEFLAEEQARWAPKTSGR